MRFIEENSFLIWFNLKLLTIFSQHVLCLFGPYKSSWLHKQGKKNNNNHNGQLKINIKKDVQVTKNNHDHPAMLGPVE